MRIKGFTLVELMVSLGILSTGLLISITLVLYALNIENTTRQRTEATALAQKHLAEAHSKLISNCSKADITLSDTSACPTIPGANFIECFQGGDSANFRVGVDEVNFDTTPVGSGGYQIASDDFIKLNTIVTWQDKFGADQSFEVTQYIAKPRLD